MFQKNNRKSKWKDNYSVINEQFKNIRTGIDFSGINQKKQVFLVTSPESGTGKSTVAAHLAATYAQKGEKTLLIDADMRKPTLHKRFSKNLNGGLSNIITGGVYWEDGLQTVRLDDCNFSILTSGSIPPNPNDLLSSSQMTELLDALKECFDVIILDTPPVTIVSDALVLGELVDGMILVCRYNRTLKEKAVQANNKLKFSKAKLLGVIFNGTENSEEYYY
ncbi:CpsD/CapB family tyrosine-protein kinase [Listeria booriae]|uniref:CpsD/CapB family tyrosine-protein kinase n=1 Tax=Listeria booriae TaxID=1552123 RepID=UPI0016295B00|nr:CpsD/CapB family tyrosine-protein kinase [Listeria booriae]MBC1576048.1 CpsD/CapB family tyrosine-protein kinase [Listeria booriae]MBC2057996.1 CpsD/CapB family tyrosine-protein kinase [Listeria booriae]MBC2069384.1 CpsD/CapB family tyrosine-protein kinase [Listeria booriae]MBC2106580.1 CpsD/CapB family tyrosine-protein kinase [Listeria booriae]